MYSSTRMLGGGTVSRRLEIEAPLVLHKSWQKVLCSCLAAMQPTCQTVGNVPHFQFQEALRADPFVLLSTGCHVSSKCAAVLILLYAPEFGHLSCVAPHLAPLSTSMTSLDFRAKMKTFTGKNPLTLRSEYVNFLTFGKSPYCLLKSISRLVAWTSADSGAEKIDRIGSSLPICPSQRFNIAFGRSKESKLSRVTQPVAGMFANVNVGRP